MHSDKANTDRDPITITVPQACHLSGYGPTTVWRLIKERRLRVIRVPGIDRTLISYDSLRQLLEGAGTQPQAKRRRGRPRKAQPGAQPEAAASQEVTP
jgi:excisionase family DNA binding protein